MAPLVRLPRLLLPLLAALLRPCGGEVGDYGLKFNGRTNMLVLSNGAADLSSTSFTLESWVKVDLITTTTIDQYVFGQGVNQDFRGLQVGFNKELRFRFSFWNTSAELCEYTPATYLGDQGSWHHWAVSYEAGSRTARVYRDGFLQLQCQKPAHYQGTGTFYAARGVDGGWFKGSMEEIRVWSGTAVSRARIRTYMSLTAGTVVGYHPSRANLLAYWRLDDFVASGTETVALDESGNGNNITNFQNGAIKVSGLPTFTVDVPDVARALAVDESLVGSRERVEGGGPFPTLGIYKDSGMYGALQPPKLVYGEGRPGDTRHDEGTYGSPLHYGAYASTGAQAGTTTSSASSGGGGGGY